MASNIWHAGLICVSPASWPDCGKVRSSWMRSGGGIGSSVKHCDITCMAGSSNHPFDSTPPETQSPVVPSRVTQRTAQPTAGFRFIRCEEGNSMIVNAATTLALGHELSCSGDRRRHRITGRSQRNGQQRIEMAAVADHETFDETQGPSLVTYLIQIDTCREQIRPSIPHDPDHEEWRFGGDVICAARDDHRQADDMAIVLPLVDIGSPEGSNPVAEHCSGVRIDDAGAVATLVVFAGCNLVQAVGDK